MHKVFKILREIYDKKVVSNIQKLDNIIWKKMHCKKNIRKFSFSCRITSISNSLPKELIHGKTVNNFEIALDKYWRNQYV
jgi:hypothetical protein